MLCSLNLLNHYGMLHIANLFTDKLNVAFKKSKYNSVTHPTIYSCTYGLTNNVIRYFTYQYVKRINV